MNGLKEFLDNERTTCEELLRNLSETLDVCPPNFDEIYCWPATAFDNVVELPCPIFNKTDKSINRWCTANVTKIKTDNKTFYEWLPANYTECFIIDNPEINLFYQPRTNFLDDIEIDLNSSDMKIITITKIGFTTSVISLLIALSIFTLIHRLQDTRVKIHINLFISLIIEAFTWLMQTTLLEYWIAPSLATKNSVANNNASLACKILTVIGRHFKLTCFTWICIEGWYFYSFICRPYKKFAAIKSLIFIGWGFPFSLIIPYIIIHMIASETHFCWKDSEKENVLAIPTVLLAIINLCLFLLCIRVLFYKLKWNNLHNRQKYFWKWFKSTLMLMPLFGAYDIFFCIQPWIKNEIVKRNFLKVVQIVCSFQGIIITTLYCFLNNEVKAELIRSWYNWKANIEIRYNHMKHQSNPEISSDLSIQKN